MNPITLVFGSFVLYTAVKGRLASYWALATTKASAQAPSNQVAGLQASNTGQVNAVPSPTTFFSSLPGISAVDGLTTTEGPISSTSSGNLTIGSISSTAGGNIVSIGPSTLPGVVGQNINMNGP